MTRPCSTIADCVLRSEEMFSERGVSTPADPLEFHLYHLREYWDRLVGFARVWPDSPETFVKGPIGNSIRVANDFAAGVIGSSQVFSETWQSYISLAEVVLNHREVSAADVEAASAALDSCRTSLTK